MRAEHSNGEQEVATSPFSRGSLTVENAAVRNEVPWPPGLKLNTTYVCITYNYKALGPDTMEVYPVSCVGLQSSLISVTASWAVPLGTRPRTVLRPPLSTIVSVVLRPSPRTPVCVT